jgi:hypothetical protein
VNAGWQRQAESAELADGGWTQMLAIGKLALAAATHYFSMVREVGWVLNPRVNFKSGPQAGRFQSAIINPQSV